MKTACIYHSIDLDGFMSAAIVKHWFCINHSRPIFQKKFNIIVDEYSTDNINFIGYNYGQPIPDLSGYDKVIMCDISFPKKEMEKLYEKLNNNFIWIDHHISAIKDNIHSNHIINGKDESKFMFNGLRDTNFAACELTWKYFFPNKTMPEIIRLLGRYDCFGHKFTKEDSDRLDTLCDVRDNSACEQIHLYQEEMNMLLKKKDEEQKVLEFQYGARQCISNYEEAYRELLNCIDIEFNNRGLGGVVGASTYKIHQQGKSIYKYLCTEAKQTYKNGFEIKLVEEITDHIGKNIVNRKFICINKERFNPINFGIDYHKDGYDGAACFHFDGTHWCFSLYNDNGLVDCSNIAKQFGGGGHKGAAGFIVNDITKILNNEYSK